MIYWPIQPILFLFGAVVGSFLNVCIYRLPRGESVVFPASHCPHCNHQIAWYDNVPILSWLVLWGRCRSCRQPISPVYPLVELAAALVTLQVYALFGLSWSGLALIILGYAFIVLTMIDLYHYILPDVITLPGIFLGLVLAALPLVGFHPLMLPLAGWEDALYGAVGGGGGLWAFAWSFKLITGKDGMGFGDVKLLALIGAWLGWQALPFTLFVSALVGSVVGIFWIIFFGRDRHLPIPFGPYLVLAAWLYIFVGPDLYAWYFHQFLRLS